MLLATHAIFSAGLVALVSTVLHLPTLTKILACMVAGLMQFVIDAFSHEKVSRHGKVYRVRTKLFHSPTGALVIGLVFAPLLWYLDRGACGAPIYPLLTLVSSFSHLALDAVTERGIYVRGKRTVRKGKRLLRSNDPLANTIFTALGLAMLAYSFGLLSLPLA